MIQTSHWTRASLAFVALVLAIGVSAAVACDNGAGSSLSSCPNPIDVVPLGACATGTACPSAAALPDCPGSTGNLTCNCGAEGWVCADPSGAECNPDASTDEAGDDAGDETGDDGGGDADQGDADLGTDAPADTAAARG